MPNKNRLSFWRIFKATSSFTVGYTKTVSYTNASGSVTVSLFSVSANDPIYQDYYFNLIYDVDYEVPLTVPYTPATISITTSIITASSVSLQTCTDTVYVQYNVPALPVTRGIYGWYDHLTYSAQSGESLSNISYLLDKSGNNNHFSINVRRSNTPWFRSGGAPGGATKSFILKTADNNLGILMYSDVSDFRGRKLAVYYYFSSYTGYKTKTSPEVTLGRKPFSYSKGYSVFFVYKNYYNPLHTYSRYNFVISLSMLGLLDKWVESGLFRITTSNLTNTGLPILPLHSPVCINRFAPVTSYAIPYFDSYPQNEVGWFMTFHVPPVSIGGTADFYSTSFIFSSSLQIRDFFVAPDNTAFRFSFSNFLFEHAYQYSYSKPFSYNIPAIAIARFAPADPYGEKRMYPVILPYISPQKYYSLSAAEKTFLHYRFLFTKDQYIAVGFIVEENKDTQSVPVTVSYTWSIYFNETTSTVYSMSMTLPPTTAIPYYEFIDGTYNNPDYKTVYGGVSIGSLHAAAGEFFSAYATGIPYDTEYVFAPFVASMSLYEVIIYTTSLFNEAPQVMEYLMKKYGIPINRIT